MQKVDIAVIGNYTQDRIIRRENEFLRLGGPPAFISSLFEALDLNYKIVAKVGNDFMYFGDVKQKPIVSDKPSCSWECVIESGRERQMRFTKICDEIRPEDIDFKAKIAIVSGVIGEISPETFRKIRESSDIVICDAQGIIRFLDDDGKVFHKKLRDTKFTEILD